jgi:phage gp29-like protein
MADNTNKNSGLINKARSLLTNNWFGNKLPVSEAGKLPVGNVIDQTGVQANSEPVVVTTQRMVKELEPYGTKVPKKILERSSGWSQLQNLSHEFTLEKVQSAFRQAERGSMNMLFAFYRDFFTNNAKIVSSLNKRKLAVVSDAWTILPRDKKNPDDVLAAKVLTKELNNCQYFNDALIHLMNAIIFPVAVLDKTFKESNEVIDLEDNTHFQMRYSLNNLYTVDYQLLNWVLAYIPQGPINIGNQTSAFTPPLTQTLTGRPEDTIYDPDSWEPNLRFWSVLDNGLINYAYAYMYAPDPNKHIIYRSNLLNGIARENYAGIAKSLLFLCIMEQMDLDVFMQCLQKYGKPIIIGKVDTSQVDTVQQILDAFGNIDILNAIAVNKDAQIEIAEMNYTGAADAHTKYLDFINNMIDLLILGQTLDSNKSTGGMGSGKESLQSDVRNDIIKYDRLNLANCLHHQLFKQILEINGLQGDVYITWAGGNTINENKIVSETLVNLNNAGLEPTDDSIEILSEKLGFTIQRIGGGVLNKDINDKDKDTETNKLEEKQTDNDKEETKENDSNNENSGRSN